MTQHQGSFIAYYRVSTDRQGKSGLGLEAQREAVSNYLNGGEWTLIAEFTEVESGRRNDRPQLEAAITACRKHKARLIVAKLDRLSRNVAFTLALRDSGVDVLFCDLPDVKGAMGRFVVTTMASVAELERGLISERTKAALKAAKARGIKLGNPALAVANRDAAQERAETLRPVIEDLASRGITAARSIANELNAKGIETPSGKQWSGMTAYRLRERLA